MADIVLATLNARFQHCALGLRCLLANMGELRPRTTLLERTLGDRPLDVAEAILRERPRIVGLSVYVWNVTALTELARILERLAPEVVVVVGGPEVSHEVESPDQTLVGLADYVVTGEGELAFAALCRDLLAGHRPGGRVIAGGTPKLDDVSLPFDCYSDHDLAERFVYVEASRGCPYECAFCLSALDERVRAFPLDALLAGLDGLLARGARHFKFVDRTFNLGTRSRVILEFFLARLRPGLFLHFEVMPDRLSPDLRALVARFPAGVVQLEVGIQSLNAEALRGISRDQDSAAALETLAFLAEQTEAHIHADLIIGLPGEDAASFARGFDTLWRTGVEEIQVGILKRLRGAPITQHPSIARFAFCPTPPYEVLRNDVLSFEELQDLKRAAHVWNVVGNSGNFVETIRVLAAVSPSLFGSVRTLAHFVTETHGQVHALALERLAELLLDAFPEHRPLLGPAMWEDFVRLNRRMPRFLVPYAQRELPPWKPRGAGHGPVRQRRHETAVEPR